MGHQLPCWVFARADIHPFWNLYDTQPFFFCPALDSEVYFCPRLPHVVEPGSFSHAIAVIA